MKRKKVCAVIAGVINLVYAISFTGGIIFAVILGILSAFDVNTGGNDLTAGLQALAGIMLLLIAFIIVLILIVPCILSWISSIGLLKRARKGTHNSGFAILSIVNSSILVIIGLVGAILSKTDGVAALICLAVAVLVLSIGNIVLSAMGIVTRTAALSQSEPAVKADDAD